MLFLANNNDFIKVLKHNLLSFEPQKKMLSLYLKSGGSSRVRVYEKKDDI